MKFIRLQKNDNLKKNKVYDIIYLKIKNKKILYYLNLIMDIIPFSLFVYTILKLDINKIEILLNKIIDFFIIAFILNNITILPYQKIEHCHLPWYQKFFFGGCRDKIPSGHFGIVLIILLFNFTPNLFLHLFIIFYGLLIVSTRNHYSIDILSSYFIVKYLL